MRADLLLVTRGLAESRTLARRFIEAGRVRADGVPVRKASDALADDAVLAVAPGDEDRYVSRAGLKLAGALAHTGVNPAELECLDVGQSTGGFTDCLLQAGARRVVGVDVGHGQLHARVGADPRVVAIEGLNARELGPAMLGTAMPEPGFDLVVIDVSFISLSLVLPGLRALARPGAALLALVKPQFEVGRANLDRHGIVRSPQLYEPLLDTLTACANTHGWRVTDRFDSPITGGDGNREFFLHGIAS